MKLTRRSFLSASACTLLACGLAIWVNGLTEDPSAYRLFAMGTDGTYHEFSGNWSLEHPSGKLRAKDVCEIRFALQDGGAYDLSPDAKEVTVSVLLAR